MRSDNLNMNIEGDSLVITFQYETSKWTIKVPKEKLKVNCDCFRVMGLSWHPLTGLKVSLLEQMA